MQCSELSTTEKSNNLPLSINQNLMLQKTFSTTRLPIETDTGQLFQRQSSANQQENVCGVHINIIDSHRKIKKKLDTAKTIIFILTSLHFIVIARYKLMYIFVLHNRG